MVKIIKKLMMLSLLLVLLSLGLTQQSDIQITQNYQLMYEADNIEEALEVASFFDLEFIDYSKYGVAIYETDDLTKKDQYLSLGFDINGQNRIANGSPFPDTNEDPYINDQYAIPMMEIDSAWNLELGDPNYLIAIIDTGIDTDHEEFLNRISLQSYNVITEEVGLPAVEDTNGHGTNVAGVIGAIKDNQTGIAGVVQNSILLVIKANNEDDPLTTDEDESELFSDANIAKAINYAAEQGADVINLSLGGPGYNSIVQKAVNDATALGSIVVAASGNEGTSDELYPASYVNVISVGAVDSSMNIASYSNYNAEVDISAPGSQIVTTHIGNTYVSASGTSFAAPQVSAVIALFQSYLPGFTDQQTIDRLYQTAMDRGSIGKDNYYGYGIINAYQAMLVDAITISFDTNGGSLINAIEVPKDEVFYVDPPTKEGYDFDGWYLDQTLTQYFNIGVDTRTVDTTLYAKYVAKQFTVTFVTSGSQVDPILVTYGNSLSEPITTKDGYTFDGWYYDSEYALKYNGEIITNELTLYARFIKDPYVVTFYVNGMIDQTYEVNEGDTFDLYTPIGDEEFLGWYLEPSFETLYQPSVVTSDLNLYAKFDNNQFSVIYYDSDLETIMEIQYVIQGESAIPPNGPDKASTASFEYIFLDWSDDASNITENLNIYPIYERQFIEESVSLVPGLDTVYQFSTWNDAGLDIEDDLVTYILRNEPDLSLVGRYVIYYDLYAFDEIVKTIVRVVNVVYQPSVKITLNPDVTTIYEGDTYQDAGATSNIGQITSEGHVDVNTPGVYTITYQVLYNNETYTKTKYIYVLDKQSVNQSQTLYVIPKQEGWLS